MSTATLLATGAGKKGLENVFNDIYGLLKKSLTKKVAVWRALGKIDGLYHKWRRVRLVKTIWQVEKAIDLAKFYCPSRVKIDTKRRQIDDIGDLPDHQNIVIRGTVGQGKSIFFRYLTARELAKGNAIPLFVELRRIGRGRSLRDHLLEELESLGIKIDVEILYFLCKQGKIILFLDAFDEVSEEQRTVLVEEIEHLCKRYEALRVFISSRPNSGIENSAFFSVYDLSPLEGDEYKDVIRRMCHRGSDQAEIIAGVKRTGIDRILTTPLMVALLLVRYRIDQSIPENMISFYDDLFYLLLRRHDKSKAGYVRPRKSKLSDLRLKQLFDGICYLSRKESPSRLTLRDLHEYADEARSHFGLECDVAKVVEDIIEITCMILEEGGECRFIHKSVQEFHAASFISDQPDEIAKRFYQAMLTRWDTWEAELYFLSQTDDHRYRKWFLSPDLRKSIEYARKHWSTNGRPTIASADSLFRRTYQIKTLGFSRGNNPTTSTIVSNVRNNQTFTLKAQRLFKAFNESLDVVAIREAVKSDRLPTTGRVFAYDEFTIKLTDLLKTPPFRAQLIKAVRYVHDNLVSERDETMKLLECVKERGTIFEF